MQEFATEVMGLMNMLLSIAHEDHEKSITSSSSQRQQPASSHLEHLICSLQSQLLFWCQQCLTDEEQEDGRHHGDRDSDDESRCIVQAIIVGCTYDCDAIR